MRFHVVLRYIGMVLLFNAAFMLISALISYTNGIDSGYTPLMLSTLLTATLGLFPMIFVKSTRQINSKESYAIMIGAWIMSCVVGTFPFLMWGGEFTFTNAWFESVSGFTTTGSTILSDIEALPKGLLFWRSSTHWLGGAGVVIFSLVILPSFGKARSTITSVELSSLARDNYRYRTRKIVQIICMVYIGLTISSTLLFKLAGMDWFDAINHSFSVSATGGFSTKNASLAYYDNVWIDLVAIFFMLIGGIHLGVIYATVTGKKNNMFRSEIARYYLISTLVACTIISISLVSSGRYDSFGEAARYGFFQGISMVSTTGFATADANLWPPIALFFIILLGIQCGCAGSTSGGLKADRVVLAGKLIKQNFIKQQHPTAVMRTKIDGTTQDSESVNYAILYIVMFVMLVIIGSIVNTACGMDIGTSFTASLTWVGNVGPAFGSMGGFDSFAALPEFAKLFGTLLMLLGRLEIFGLLQLFLMKWWI
ncbi:MAG: TrkH family potassium uptake protein [Tidjanibacter sp.]|nr:TrkH family potassium uptake protein [Tidjanibacter sp.]